MGKKSKKKKKDPDSSSDESSDSSSDGSSSESSSSSSSSSSSDTPPPKVTPAQIKNKFKRVGEKMDVGNVMGAWNKKAGRDQHKWDLVKQSMERQRMPVIEYLSNECEVFSETSQKVKITVKKLDSIISQCGGPDHVVTILSRFDRLHRKFDSFDELVVGVMMSKGSGKPLADNVYKAVRMEIDKAYGKHIECTDDFVEEIVSIAQGSSELIRHLQRFHHLNRKFKSKDAILGSVRQAVRTDCHLTTEEQHAIVEYLSHPECMIFDKHRKTSGLKVTGKGLTDCALSCKGDIPTLMKKLRALNSQNRTFESMEDLVKALYTENIDTLGENKKSVKKDEGKKEDAKPKNAFLAAARADEDEKARIKDEAIAAVGREAKREEEMEAMQDWVEFKDPNTGKPYYYNNVTNETSWKHPLKEKRKREKASKKGFKKRASYVEPKDRDEDGPQNVAQSDWVEYMDQSTGKTYYYNTITKATTWNKPREFNSDGVEKPIQQGLRVGDKCEAVYVVDGVWYEATVKRIKRAKNSTKVIYDVMFPTFGTTETVKRAQIRSIHTGGTSIETVTKNTGVPQYGRRKK